MVGNWQHWTLTRVPLANITPVLCGSSEYFPLTWLLSDIRNWIRNIEQHASDNVNKILVGNKADMDESKRVGTLVLVLCVCDCSNARLSFT